jgi:hypothetical protein
MPPGTAADASTLRDMDHTHRATHRQSVLPQQDPQPTLWPVDRPSGRVSAVDATRHHAEATTSHEPTPAPRPHGIATTPVLPPAYQGQASRRPAPHPERFEAKSVD